MRAKLSSFDIVHANFSLKWALFFFDKFSFTDFKIHFKGSLETLFKKVDIEQKTFILGAIPIQVKEFDDEKSGLWEESTIIGKKRGFTKDVISSSDK